MGVLIAVDNALDVRIAEYANLHEGGREGQEPARGSGPGTIRRSSFVAEGELIARQAVESRFTVRSMLMSSAKVESMGDVISGLPGETPIYVAEPRLMSEIVGFKFHRGALVCCERGEALTVAEAIHAATSVVVLEQVSNFDNLGGIFRNVSALGGDRPAVLLSPGCCDPLYRKCVRVSMGHVLRVPFAEAEHWPDVIENLAREGFSVIGLSTGATSLRLDEISPQRVRRPALVLGTEGAGLSVTALESIDLWGVRARIPMRAGVDSLNVNVAAAIALYGVGLVIARGSTHS